MTSTFLGKGKALKATNLATFSKGYSETVLLSGGCSVSEMLTWPGLDILVVASGVRPVSESSELLGSPAMEELVE